MTLWLGLWTASLVSAFVLMALALSLLADTWEHGGKHVRRRVNWPLFVTTLASVGVASLFVGAHLLGVPFGGL